MMDVRPGWLAHTSTAMLRSVRLLILLAAAVVPGAATAQPGLRAQAYLTWNAPWGQPRASDVRNVVCGDSSRRDTLYLTFDPVRDRSTLIAVDAEIRVWPSDGDTLDRHWWFESRSNPAHLLADFNLDDVPGALRVWTETGAGGVRSVSGPDTAFIRLVWAVRPADAATVLGGKQYAFARLIVPRPRDAGVCGRPLCFELNYVRLARDIRDTEVVWAGRKWVSWNPGSNTPCAERVRQARLGTWRPAKKP